MSDFFKLTGILGLLAGLVYMVYAWVMNIVNLIGGVYESTSTMIMGFIGVPIPFVGAVVHIVAG